MNSFEIALKTKQLPDKIEELVPMMFIGQAGVKFLSAKLKLLSNKNIPDPLGILEEQRQKTVEDGQCSGELLLQVMGKIGEISEEIPRENIGSGVNKYNKGQRLPNKANALKHEKLGLKSKKQLEQAQFIKNHPDLVQETIKECKENDDIPNITTVLNKHKYARALAKEKERREKAEAEGRNKKSNLEITMEQEIYLSKLQEIIFLLPKEPPKNWKQNAFNTVCGYVDVIISRLEYFKKFLIKE